MQQDSLDEQHVREGISDRLVDDVDERFQVCESLGFGWVRGRVGRDCRERSWGQEDGSVSVRFEIDSDVVGSGGVVKMFDSRRNASDGDFLFWAIPSEHSMQ